MRSIKFELLKGWGGGFGDADHVTQWKASEVFLNSESVPGRVFLGNIFVDVFLPLVRPKK